MNSIQGYSQTTRDPKFKRVGGFLKGSAMGCLNLVGSLECPSEVMCCRVSHDGKFLAVGLSSGVIKVYLTETLDCLYSLANSGPLSHLPVTSLRWKPKKSNQEYDFMLLAIYASGDIKSWHVTSGKSTTLSTEDRQCLALAYDATGDNFVVAGSDGKINYYDGNTGVCTSVFAPGTNTSIMDGHVMRVFAVQFNPSDDNVFVTGGWDDTIQWWDVRERHSIKKISGPHVCGEGLDIQPSTLNMAVASWRKTENLQVYDFGSGKLLKSVPVDLNRTMYYCVQWKNDESFIAGGSHENMIRSINYGSVQTSGRILDLPGAVYCVDVKKSGTKYAVVAGTSKWIIVMEDTM